MNFGENFKFVCFVGILFCLAQDFRLDSSYIKVLRLNIKIFSVEGRSYFLIVFGFAAVDVITTLRFIFNRVDYFQYPIQLALAICLIWCIHGHFSKILILSFSPPEIIQCIYMFVKFIRKGRQGHLVLK